MGDLSLYIHIPFCVQKCRYCDFLSFPECDTLNYVNQLKKQIVFSAKKIPKDSKVITIFIGGGTPSLLDAESIVSILDCVRYSFDVYQNAEVTIECNPGTIDENKLNIYKEAGINRLSIGLQSALDSELRLLGRIHTWDDFLSGYKFARKVGFTNINIDLISALPFQKSADYEKTLMRVLELEPEHISAYSLQLEEGTYLYEHADEYEWPTEDEDRELYYLTERILRSKDYRRYEISNYSKLGYESVHNQVYWTGGDYLGLGLGAASLLQGTRFSNTSDMKTYMDIPFDGDEKKAETDLLVDITKLSFEDQMEEYMFLGLRRMDGISANGFKSRFSREIESVYGDVLARLSGEGLIAWEKDNIRLTGLGIDISNYVLAQFLLD